VTGDRWQLLPPLSDEEYAALKADIAVQGVLLPVVIDAETGEVIEGHHRLRAWAELRAEGTKVADYPKQLQRFASDDDRVAFVLAANLFRRHLNREQRAEVVARLREQGWSLRRIGETLGVHHDTVREDLQIVGNPTITGPERVERKGGGTYPARRAPTVFVQSDRDARRAAEALRALGDDASGVLGLARAEERARDARLAQLRSLTVPRKIEGPAFELRLGDLREVWTDQPDGSIDCVVCDPPYDDAGIPLFEDLARLAARVLKPGRLAAIYCGHLHLDAEMELLAKGGLTYVWHCVNVLPGRHTQIRHRMINGRHRSVLLFSAGAFQPRRWLHDAYFAEGRGGAETRQLHRWQQAVEPVRHWVRAVSEPGEVVFDPTCGSGTTALAAVAEHRRFLGGDIDPGCVETARRRLVELASGRDDEKTAVTVRPPGRAGKR
jgi:ParB-like chromosome segregation protein Spo0J